MAQFRIIDIRLSQKSIKIERWHWRLLLLVGWNIVTSPKKKKRAGILGFDGAAKPRN